MAQALRSTRVLTADGLRPATLIVDGEKIGAVRAWDDIVTANEVSDFGDLLLLPGLVDSHVHINDPGRDWEGFERQRALPPLAASPLSSTCPSIACPKP